METSSAEFVDSKLASQEDSQDYEIQ